ncbi:fatty acyl-AMP ligase [soil metagenome]
MLQLVRTPHGRRDSPPAMPTPTRNSSLPFRRGGFASLCAALDYAARGETGLNFFDARGRLSSCLPYSVLQSQAQAFARRLIAGGIGRGERLLLIAETWPGFCIAFFGAQYAGIVPVPVPVPIGLGAKDSYIATLRRSIEASGAIGILAPDDLAAFAITAAEGTTARLAGTMAAFEAALPQAAVALRPLTLGEACYVQFSSGSTRAPLGIDIRQDQLMANIDGSIAIQELNEDDSGVSWLPLYHDMGLVGFMLAPMCAQRSVDLLAPRDFARRPTQWLSLISRRRATITYSPSFGYDLAARRANGRTLDGIDLSCLRLAGVGADMIQMPMLDRFAKTFAAAGFDARAFMASYGMAEVCVGLTFGRRFGGIRLDSLTASRLGATGKPRAFVVCGRLLPGHRIEVRSAESEPLADRQIGRLFVQGPSVMPGYFDQAAESDKVLRDGWFDTGDLGYLTEGEIVITGRAKDLIIVNGRNIWPQDIEWALETMPRLRRGDACAFSVDEGGGEAVIVVVQGAPSDPVQRQALVGEIHQLVREAAGVDCRIALISRQPGLPLTSSGKLSRAAAKVHYNAGAYGGAVDRQEPARLAGAARFS